MKNFKLLDVIEPIPEAHDWKCRTANPELNTTGIKETDHCLFLGEIPRMRGHCAVIRSDGVIVWALHTDTFRLVSDEDV